MSLNSEERARLREASAITIAGGIVNAALAALKIGPATSPDVCR